MTTPVWISLGSNLGDRRAILDAALVSLGQNPGVIVSAVSSYHETRPIGGPPGQGAFLNAAARLDTSLSPRELLAATQAVEDRLGRVRTVRWGERTLDLDLLIFGEQSVEEAALILPHPRLAVRRFVLKPLVEIAPDVIESRTGMRISDLLANLNRRHHRLLIDHSIEVKVPHLLNRLAEPLSTAVPERWVVKSTNLEHWSAIFASAATSQGINDGKNWLAKIYWSTLIVASPLRWRARPWKRFPIPIYRPEAKEPDAIVAEIVAVCRGIEAV